MFSSFLQAVVSNTAMARRHMVIFFMGWFVLVGVTLESMVLPRIFFLAEQAGKSPVFGAPTPVTMVYDYRITAPCTG